MYILYYYYHDGLLNNKGFRGWGRVWGTLYFHIMLILYLNQKYIYYLINFLLCDIHSLELLLANARTADKAVGNHIISLLVFFPK